MKKVMRLGAMPTRRAFAHAGMFGNGGGSDSCARIALFLGVPNVFAHDDMASDSDKWPCRDEFDVSHITLSSLHRA